MSNSCISFNNAASVFGQRITDYHCHLLPGLDDGSPNLDESIQMALLLAAAGYREVYCTPHMMKGVYEVNNDDVLEAITKLQASLDNENIKIKLLAGREYYLDEYFPQFIKQPLLLEGTNFFMIELSNHGSPAYVKDVLFDLICKGYVPLICHPERCSLLREEVKPPSRWKPHFFMQAGRNEAIQGIIHNSLLEYLCEIGCKFQGNLGSVTGFYGKHVSEIVARFNSMNLYSYAGTDAHSAGMLRGIL